MKSASLRDSTGFDPAELIEQHQVGVWRYLRALGCEPTVADDLTQETFLAVLKKPFQDYSPAATATYLRRTAYNLFVTQQRRKGHVIAVENLEHLDQNWSRWAGRDNGEALLDALRACLNELGDRARLALDLRFRDGAARAEIAHHLQIGEHGAKNLMQRAKQQLRTCIEGKLQ
jgi:RNA polymerase sigma-70 factor (ECF subfamily)